MADPKLQVFRMPFSADGKNFGTLVIDAGIRETTSTGDGALPLRTVSPRMAPGQPQALVFSTPNFAPGNTSADVEANVNPQLGGKLPDEPVEVEVLVGPMQALDDTRFPGGELLKKCAVRISDVMIDWDTEPAEFKQGDRIVIPADGQTKFTLIARAQRLVPGQGVVPDDDTIEFTHMLERGSFEPPIRDVFAPAKQPSDRRENRSEWHSVMELPNPAKDITLPAECKIRVKAWWGPKGAVTRVGWNDIALKAGACLKDLIRIPVVLVEPKAVVELLEPPEMPIPANGEPQELTLQLFWEIAADGAKSKKPAKGLEVTVEQQPDPKGKLESKYEQPTQPADEEGKVTFRYTPPKLTYKPGGKYHENFDVYTGKGDARRKIGEARIDLSPEIKIRFKGEKDRLVKGGAEGEGEGQKFGLVFDIREITIPAEEKVHTLTGKAWLQPSGNGPNERKLEVNAAKLSIEYWNGTDFVSEGDKGAFVETKPDGTFAWDFKELIPEKGKRPEGTHALDEDTEAPLAALNPMAEEMIHMYEDRVNRFCPFDILSPGLTADLKDYRKIFREQLAQQKTDQFIKIISATEALRAASTYTHSYRKFYENISRIFVDQLRDLFMAIVEVVIAFFSLADKFAKWLGTKLSAWASSGSKLSRWFSSKVATKLFNKCRSTAHAIREGLEKLSRDPSKFGQPISEWERFLAKLLAKANTLLAETEAEEDLLKLVTGVTKLIGEYLAALVGNWFKQFLAGLKLVLVGRFANLLFGADRTELLERWISQIAEDTFKALVGWLNDLLTTASGGGRPVIDIAAMFDSFTPTVETVLREVHTAAKSLNVPEDYETRQENLRNGFVALRDSGLKWELALIETDLAMEYINMTLTYVQYFLIAVCTFTTVVGAVMVGKLTTAISVSWGALRGAFRVLGPARTSYSSAVTITVHYRAQVSQLIR